jgi:glutamyl/glutaminyl-tRNA synthetase
MVYRGRLAPTPSGYLHVGHAQTFSIAMYRSSLLRLKVKDPKAVEPKDTHEGVILLRIEDLDAIRCKAHYLLDMIEDLSWFGIRWSTQTEFSSLKHILSSLESTCEDSSALKDGSEKVSSLGTEQGSNTTFSAVYKQSDNISDYKHAWYILYKKGFIYPSSHSRRDVEASVSAPHEGTG